MRSFLLGMVLLFPATALADYSFCLTANKVASEKGLKYLSDEQVRNGLCMTTREWVEGIQKNDYAKKQICSQAAEYMLREFKRRFPRSDPKEVSNRC